MIIGLLGKKFSGKSTAAEVFENKGFRRISYAGPLKEIVSKAFELDMKLLTDPVLKETYKLNFNIDTAAVIRLLKAAQHYYPISVEQTFHALDNVPTMPVFTPRQLLQLVGTEVFRNYIDKDYWLKAFQAQIDGTNDFVV